MIARGAKRGNSGSRREAALLGRRLEKSLSAYAGAAMATGVSLVAMAMPAEAEVVYTPANTNLPVNGGAVLLDLDHNGVADFAFWNLRFTSGTGFRSSHRTVLNLYVGCAPAGSTCQNQGNEIWGRGVGSRYCRFASALPAGVHVGPNKSYFQQSPKINSLVPSPVARMAKFALYYSYQGYPAASATYGQWMFTNERYLGLQFMISGQVHYGWARVAVTAFRDFENNNITATLTGYAYETIPDKPIITGATKLQKDVVPIEPASLGHLAQGASGISAWRESN
jgi:hypothetical protein